MKKFLSVVHYGDYIRNLPQGIKQNPVMMSSFGYLSPTPSDSLVASSSTSTCFDFSLFVSAPLRLNDTVRDKISPFFGFFAMPRRELSLELCFADEKFVSSFNKVDNICRKCTWYRGPYAGLRPELDGA
ncbi:hypothetical protein G6F21_013966 [Rhizopus arrhizus]|nr:hypothetical protein G6F21_013966 [Rhizopus arrhizus]